MGCKCSCLSGQIPEVKTMEICPETRVNTLEQIDVDLEHPDFTYILLETRNKSSYINDLIIKSVVRGYLSRKSNHRVLESPKTSLKGFPYPYYRKSLEALTPCSVKIIESKYGSLSLPYKSTDSIDVTFKPAVKLGNGNIYEGEWDLEKLRPHGRGTEILPNGTKYTGYFRKRK